MGVGKMGTDLGRLW